MLVGFSCGLWEQLEWQGDLKWGKSNGHTIDLDFWYFSRFLFWSVGYGDQFLFPCGPNVVLLAVSASDQARLFELVLIEVLMFSFCESDRSFFFNFLKFL